MSILRVAAAKASYELMNGEATIDRAELTAKPLRETRSWSCFRKCSSRERPSGSKQTLIGKVDLGTVQSARRLLDPVGPLQPARRLLVPRRDTTPRSPVVVESFARRETASERVTSSR